MGLRQSTTLAQRLAAIPFTVLYSSDLERARQTALCIAAKTGHQIVFDARLRERDLGIFAGLTKAEIKAQHPIVFAGYESGGVDYVIPEGESTRQRHQRSVRCLEEFASMHKGERIVVVTHGGVLNGLLRHCLGTALDTPRTFAIFNASFNVFYFENNHWRLVTWGDVSHLQGLDPKDDP